MAGLLAGRPAAGVVGAGRKLPGKSGAVARESAPASRLCSPDPQGAPLEAGTGASDQYLEGTPRTSPGPGLSAVALAEVSSLQTSSGQ